MTRFSNSQSSEIPFEAEDAADYWAAKHMLGTLDGRDEARFRAWIEEPVNADAYARTEALGLAASDIAADPAILALRADALTAGPAPKAVAWRPLAAIAASVIVVVGVGVVSLEALGDQTPATVVTAQAGPWALPGTKRYETRVGERRDIRLDDGSVIALNTGSVIEVVYTAARRDVRLLQGQALFQVAHNGKWPFVVAAGDRAVTAVGTAFDIRLDGGEVKVVLVEGKVRVAPLQHQGLERLLPMLGDDTLVAGQQLMANQGERSVLVNSADVARVTSWRNGQVIFRDDTIATAVAELNRYSETPIVLADPRVGTLKVSGVFGTARPENFVAAVTTMLPVDASTSGGATVLKWRNGG